MNVQRGIVISVFEGAPSDKDAAVLSCVRRYAERHGVFLPEQLTIYRAPHEKPRLNGTGIYFSVSHTRDLWACGVGTAPLGIDLELHRPDCKLEAIARRFFHSEEIQYLQARGFTPEAFFPVWTAKESYVKFTGEGISDLYSSFSAVRGNSLSGRINGVLYHHYPIREGYSLCVCSQQPQPPVTIETLPRLLD